MRFNDTCRFCCDYYNCDLNICEPLGIEFKGLTLVWVAALQTLTLSKLVHHWLVVNTCVIMKSVFKYSFVSHNYQIQFKWHQSLSRKMSEIVVDEVNLFKVTSWLLLFCASKSYTFEMFSFHFPNPCPQ